MVYTRRGDSGNTVIFSVSGCIPKSHPCIHFIGSVDEAMAFTGLAIELVHDKSIREKMLKVYELLSRIAGSLYTGWCPDESLVESIEEEIDRAPKPRSFIPNFSPSGGVAPIAVVRTVVRRAERWFWECFNKTSYDCKNLGILLNRLSDYIFVIQYEAIMK